VAKVDEQWWAEVIHQLQSHVREESVFLDAYARLVDDTDDPSVRFLLGAILDDERRHHELFASMADAARSADSDAGSADAGASGDEAVPPAPRLSADTARTLLEPTERFLAAERDDHRHLAALRKDLKPLRDNTLWPLLVELMEIDTTKHVRILEYLRDRLRAAQEG
jgi:rubrerythrin